MVDVNLYPVELRKKKKRKLLQGDFIIPVEVVVGSAGGLLMLLVCVHILFVFLNMNKLNHHRQLQATWEGLKPSQDNVNVVTTNLNDLRKRHEEISGLVQKREVFWDDYPQEVWRLGFVAFGT